MQLSIDQWDVDRAIAEGFRDECLAAATSDSLFVAFREGTFMRGVVENKQPEWADRFVIQTRALLPQIFDYLDTIRRLDQIGSPRLDGELNLSGSMAAYVLQVAMIRVLFGDLDGLRIGEIGGGYGGLCSLLASICSPKSCTLYDIPAAAALQTKYAEAAGVSEIITCRDSIEPAEYDLVLSSCSLCELRPAIIKVWAENLLSRSERGMIWWGMQTHADETIPRQSVDICRWLGDLCGKQIMWGGDDARLAPAASMAGVTYFWGANK